MAFSKENRTWPLLQWLRVQSWDFVSSLLSTCHLQGLKDEGFPFVDKAGMYIYDGYCPGLEMKGKCIVLSLSKYNLFIAFGIFTLMCLQENSDSQKLTSTHAPWQSSNETIISAANFGCIGSAWSSSIVRGKDKPHPSVKGFFSPPYSL